MRSTTVTDTLLVLFTFAAIFALISYQNGNWLAGNLGGDVSWLMNQAFSWLSFVVGSILRLLNVA